MAVIFFAFPHNIADIKRKPRVAVQRLLTCHKKQLKTKGYIYQAQG